jgi:hypothetical protein
VLKIVAATEPLPVENIVLTIYAAPGLWKTSIAQTAADPLTLDFDKGVYRAFNRRASVTIVRWSDVSAMTAEDLAPYKTIVVDTAGRALDAISQDVIDGNPKMGRADGSLSLQGFGALKSRFAQWQSFLRSQRKDIILICHMDEQKNGDDTQERIDAQGSSRNEIYKSSDAMCRIRLDNRDQRYLDFDPRQGGFGKNPAQLPKIPAPNLKDAPDFLAQVIAQIKTALNHQTANQAEAVKQQDEWAEAVAEAADLPAINLLVGLSKERKLSKGQKNLLVSKSAELGFQFDKATGLYIVKPEQAVA